MRIAKLEKMVKGWFVGNFEPTTYSTKDVEVAVKRYKAGDCEEKHLHKIATEITVIVSGKVEMNNRHYMEGDIIIIEPSESTDFLALTDVTTVVVKKPSTANDKYSA
jgi:anti-sigma factor ChrR (cupin superfamily)